MDPRTNWIIRKYMQVCAGIGGYTQVYAIGKSDERCERRRLRPASDTSSEEKRQPRGEECGQRSHDNKREKKGYDKIRDRRHGHRRSRK